MRSVAKAWHACALLASLALVLGCTRRDDISSRLLIHNSTNRSYRVFVPDSVRGHGAPAPLVMVMHAGGAPVPDIMDITHMNDIALREGFVAAYPVATGYLWNDGLFNVLATNVATDVAFLRSVVDDIDRNVIKLDRRRLYAVGLSNGGMMSMRLACEAADLFAGVAAVAAAMPITLALKCRPSGQISVMVINGTDDPFVPYRGGELRIFGLAPMGRVLSTEATMEFWASHNLCAFAAVLTALPDRDLDDGSRAYQKDYPGCRGARVRLVRVEGGGHRWPGGFPAQRSGFLDRIDSILLGRANRDIDAAHAIWMFFKTAPVR